MHWTVGELLTDLNPLWRFKLAWCMILVSPGYVTVQDFSATQKDIQFSFIDCCSTILGIDLWLLCYLGAHSKGDKIGGY